MSARSQLALVGRQFYALPVDALRLFPSELRRTAVLLERFEDWELVLEWMLEIKRQVAEAKPER